MTPNNTEITAFLSPVSSEDVLDPSFVRFAQDYYYLDNMTVRLIELGHDGTYTNSLAKEISFKNDKKDLLIKIKKAFFSNGDKITATDVINTFKRVILVGSPHSSPKSFIRGASKLKSINDDIEGLKVISDDVLFIGLTGKMKELYYYLQLADYGILHQSQYHKEKLTVEDWGSATSGPYHLKVSQTGTSLISNPDSLKATKEMPQTVKMVTFKEDDKIINAMKERKVHFGLLTFKTYSQNIDTLKAIDGINYYGGKTDGIIYISLNPNSKKFKTKQVRQWINKKIQQSYTLTEQQKNYMQKANQYFLPNAKGHISQESIDSILNNVQTDSIPEELKNGLVIKTVKGMKNYIPRDFEDTLSKALGIKVTIDFSISSKDYLDELGKREFDAFMMASSMSYKVIGETLNLVYTSTNPTFIDPTGNISILLQKYQATDDSTEETEMLKGILRQMTDDSECIPIAYFAGPKFYNKDVLDISQMQLDESFQFWRLRVN